MVASKRLGRFAKAKERAGTVGPDLSGHFKTGHHRLFLRPNAYDHRIRRIMHVERSAIDFLKGKPVQKRNRGEHISGGFDRNAVAWKGVRNELLYRCRPEGQ
jgi:hypothetical protein